jgi:hypothetical protein
MRFTIALFKQDAYKRIGPNQLGQPCGRGWVGLKGACKRAKPSDDQAALRKASAQALADKIRRSRGIQSRGLRNALIKYERETRTQAQINAPTWGSEYSSAFAKAASTLKKAVKNIPTPVKIDNIEGQSAFHRYQTNADGSYQSQGIHMDGYGTDSTGRSVWRHEYGHHLDFVAGRNKRLSSPYISSSEAAQKAFRADEQRLRAAFEQNE